MRVVETDNREFEEAVSRSKQGQFILKLYVSGMNNRSRRAIENIERICAEHLEGHYKLEIIDINEKPSLTISEQIVATPALIKKLPLPLRKIVGDMSDHEKVLLAIDIKNKT